jgi:hypothetical protein
MSLLRVVLRIAGKPEVPEPTKHRNIIRVFTPEVTVPEPPARTDEEVLYALEPDRPYDWAVDGL